MRIAVIGGRLQGIESTYLAHKEGWEVVLIDKDPGAPAAGMADRFLELDITGNNPELNGVLQTVDLIIPALENQDALNVLYEKSKKVEAALAYDPHAYRISSSKNRSNTLFTEQGVPAPEEWPACTLPVIVKPSGSSGSRGIRLVYQNDELHDIIESDEYRSQETVIQEFIPGPVYSIEVFGNRDSYIAGQITRIEVDTDYDCKSVHAPTDIPNNLRESFRKYSRRIAQAVGLRGIMDVEAILRNDKWSVLEIDARFPSQTPITVYHSTGINYLAVLSDIFIRGTLYDFPRNSHEDPVVLEHIRVRPGRLDFIGEHALSGAGSLRSVKDFFGADEAITDYRTGTGDWVATLIIKEANEKKLRKKHSTIIENIKRSGHIAVVST